MTDKFGRPINRDKTSSNIKTSDVTKSYIRDNYIESEMEENINMRNQYYIKNLPNPIDLDDAVNKRYTNSNYLKITDFDNSSIVRNNTNTNFNNPILLLD